MKALKDMLVLTWTILVGLGSLYLALIMGFIGGVIQFVEGVCARPVDGGAIAWGLARFFVLPPVVWFGFALFGMIPLIVRFQKH